MRQHNDHIDQTDPAAPADVVAQNLPEWDHPAAPRVSVIIPTCNEARNLPRVFSRLPAGLHEVIVVDGRSVDGTIDTAVSLRPDVRIVRQNRVGRGNAVACGLAQATGDILVVLDADGSTDPQEIPLLVAALMDGADFAKGTRFAVGGGTEIAPLRAWGNRWLNRIANLLYRTRYTDVCCGYNALWSRCLPALQLDLRLRQSAGRAWGDGFEIGTLINTRVAKSGLRIIEVPSVEHRQWHGPSDLDTWRDGGRALLALLVERVNNKGSLAPEADRRGA